MIKFIKNNIKVLLAFVLGIFLCGGVVYATGIINANQITYVDSNNNEITVKNALDSIYNSLDNRIIMNTFGTTSYQTSQGTPMVTRSITSKSLSKGKYIIVLATGEAWNDSGGYAASNEISVSTNNISCSSNNCVINCLGGYHNQPKATSPITENYRAMMSVYMRIFYVEIKEDNDTVLAQANAAATYDTGAQFVTIQAIPIN